MTSNIARPTTAETTQSLAFFIGLSHSYTVDDEGYVVDARDMTNRHKIKGAGATDPKRPLVIYSERMPHPVDYYIVNPYAESLGLSTPSNTFFYSSIRAAAMIRLKAAIEGTIRYMQIQKGIDVDNPLYAVVGNPKCLMDATSGKDGKGRPVMELVDDKTFANVAAYMKSSHVLRDFMYIAYTKKQMVSELRIDFLNDPDFTETHDMGKLRKSDIQVIRGILMALLKLKKPEDIEKYVAHAHDGAPAKMSSWLQVMFDLYKAINPVIGIFKDDFVVDLGTFKHHLDRLAGYANNAKWMVQANGPATTGASAVPGAMGAGGAPAPSVNAGTPGYIPQAPVYQPGVSSIPGPLRNDGTVMQPQPAFQGYQPGSVPGPLPAGMPGFAPQPQYPGYPTPQPQYPGYPAQQTQYPGFAPQQGFQGMPQYPGYPQQPGPFNNVPPPMAAPTFGQFYGVPGAPPGVY